MSKAPPSSSAAQPVAKPSPAPPAVPSRPRAFEYFLILLGIFFSALLAFWSQVHVSFEPDVAGTFERGLEPAVLLMLFLPVGIMLLWPVFYLVQKLMGRKQGLTSGEWLWGLAFLASILVAVIILWRALASPPEFLTAAGFQKNFLMAYVLYSLGMAAVALVIFLIGLVGRWVTPWTHTFGLVLLLWPLAPLALLWLSGWKLQ